MSLVLYRETKFNPVKWSFPILVRKLIAFHLNNVFSYCEHDMLLTFFIENITPLTVINIGFVCGCFVLFKVCFCLLFSCYPWYNVSKIAKYSPRTKTYHFRIYFEKTIWLWRIYNIELLTFNQASCAFWFISDNASLKIV